MKAMDLWTFYMAFAFQAQAMATFYRAWGLDAMAAQASAHADAWRARAIIADREARK